MGDAQKSAFASFDRCWEPWVPVLYFMAWRWYKRASNLSRAGITISKPRKARHCCGQISGWHMFSPLSAAEYKPQLYRNHGTHWHSRDDLLTPHSFFLLLSLHEKVFGSVASSCHLLDSVSSSALSSSISSAFKKKPTLPPSSTSSVFLDKKKVF